MLKRILAEPLLHFALLGATLFAVYQVLAPRDSERSAIVVSSDQIVSIAERFRGSWQRAPTREELAQLIEARVHEEVLYREGLALGLDRDDPVVRNRVKQKVEMLAEDAITSEPSDAELRAYLDAHNEQFELPATVSLEQIYFDPARRGSALESSIAQAREALRAGRPVNGDGTMLPSHMERALPADIRAAFGSGFETAVEALPVGPWSEPVRSTFGYHLVRVTARVGTRVPALAEARDVVLREWSRARTMEAKERLYRSLRERYSVVIDPIPEAAPLTARAEDRR